jgi:UDP-2,3-diacylglucosamine pyrophosphatase LpxH
LRAKSQKELSEVAGPGEQESPQIRCRTLFISDLHLGSVSCKAEEVYEFLRTVECEQMYLVGDIIDAWVGRRENKWTRTHTEVLRYLMGRSSTCRMYYTPGNHDSFMRGLNGAEMGNLLIEHSVVHTTVDGKNILVIHGDLYDKSVTKHKKMAYMGAWGNELLGQINKKVNVSRERRDKRPLNFSAALKRWVKHWIKRKTGYEEEIISDAREAGFDGVLCGHTHKPAMTRLSDGMLYINVGDWTDNCTAVLEDFDGHLFMISWKDHAARPVDVEGAGHGA